MSGRMSPHRPTLVQHVHAGDKHLVEMLTPREMEMLQLSALGHTNKMIACALGIEERTVRQHSHHMLQKLGAQNRTHAVYIGYRTGLLMPVRVDEPQTARAAIKLAAHYSALALRLMESEGWDE